MGWWKHFKRSFISSHVLFCSLRIAVYQVHAKQKKNDYTSGTRMGKHYSNYRAIIDMYSYPTTDEIDYTPSMKKLETLMKFQHYKLKEIMHTQTNQILELEYLTAYCNCCNVKSRDSKAAIRALWCCN